MRSILRFAETDRDFSDFAAVVKRELDVDRPLPDWPFLRPTGFATIYEYYLLPSPSFGEALQALADAYRDELITVVSFVPLPTYHPDQCFPAFQMARDGLMESYATAVRQEPGPPGIFALEITLDIVGMTGDSGCWSVWGQRDWEIGLLLTPEDRGPWMEVDVPWCGRDIDLDAIRGPDGWVMPLSDSDRSTFRHNVRTRGSGPLPGTTTD